MHVLDEQLKKLQNLLIKMGDLVQENIHHSIQFILNKDTTYLEQIDKREEEINECNVKVDWQCLRLLAQQSPVATDLRFVVAVIRANADLERVGDRAQSLTHLIHDNASSFSLFLSDELTETLKKMSFQSQTMVSKALESFFKQDIKKAHWVITQDEVVNRLYYYFHEQVAKHLFSRLEKSSQTDPFLFIYSIAKILERIADHATNIAEGTIFISTGRDTRHQAHSPSTSPVPASSPLPTSASASSSPPTPTSTPHPSSAPPHSKEQK